MHDVVISYAPGTEPTPGSGPVLFGGFAFDTLSSRTQLWSRFPDGLLILPQYLLSYNAGDVSLTINLMMQATDSCELQAQQIATRAEQVANRYSTQLKHAIRAIYTSLFY